LDKIWSTIFGSPSGSDADACALDHLAPPALVTNGHLVIMALWRLVPGRSLLHRRAGEFEQR
jgi:hypothetical protein